MRNRGIAVTSCPLFILVARRFENSRQRIERRPVRRAARSEDCHRRRADCGRDVHQAGIVRHPGVGRSKRDYRVAQLGASEIAHAIARHSEERYSQMAGAQLLGGVVGAASGSQTMVDLYGLGGQLALLRYGRKQESEADRLGLIFMAMAGYNPEAAVTFWERMAQAKQGGGAPPEFLSTHPSDERRIADIQKRLPEARQYYKK